MTIGCAGRRTLSLLAAALAAVVVLLVGGLEPAAAQQTGRAARAIRYDVELTVMRGGSVVVREVQQIAFIGGPFQVGTRRIPLHRVTGIGNVRVEVDGQPYRRGRDVTGTYEVRDVGGEILVEWWFPQTVNDRRTFTITYEASGAVAYYAEGDQLRWNALPADRAYPIDQATITLRLPQAADTWRIDAYPGAFLDTRVPPEASGATAVWHARDVPPNRPFEIRAQWPSGIVGGTPPPWQAQADRDDVRRENVRPVLNLVFGAAGLLLPLAGVIALTLAWHSRGRDPAIAPVPAEIDEPPSDLPPALVGTVVDEHADVQDVVATLLDLAERGAIRVTEVVDRSLIGSQRDFEIALLDEKRLTHDFERTVVETLLSHGNPVRLTQVGDWISTSIPRIQETLHEAAYREGLFTANPAAVRRRYQRLGTLLLVGSVVSGLVACTALEGYSNVVAWPFIGIALVGALMRFTAGAMPSRTPGGALEAARWRAYGRYLARIRPTPAITVPPRVVAARSMREQASDTPAATAQADPGSPSERDIFEEMLPYAVALGIDRVWVQKFESIGSAAPRWLQDPPVIVVGPGWGGPPVGGPWGRRRRRRSPMGRAWGVPVGTPVGSSPGRGPQGAPPGAGGGPQGWSDTAAGGAESASRRLVDLLNAASEVLSRGGGSGWSGGGSGGGSFGGGFGGGGGGSGFR